MLVAVLLASPQAFALEVRVLVAPPAPPGGGSYAGPASCLPCHEPQHRFQSTGSHARAMETLPEASRSDPACLRCHATGYGYAGGFGPGGGDASLAGVTCEACHGPCGDHAANGAATPAGLSDCSECLLGKACLPCHTADRDPDFDLPKALGQAGCPKGE